jgi:hypothetical protein
VRLSRLERQWAGAIFDALVPPNASARFPYGARRAGVVDFFEAHLDYLPARTRWALRAAVGVLGAYGRVHPRGAGAALEGLATSPIYALREAVTLLKQVVCMGYYTNLDVRRELGLDARLG